MSVRANIQKAVESSGRTASAFAQAMTDHGYPLHRSSLYAITNGEQKINRHLIDTLVIVLDLPRTDLITDTAYEDLPARAKRYARLTRSNEAVKAVTPELSIQRLTDALRAVQEAHRQSTLSDRCTECSGQVYPCDTSVIVSETLNTYNRPQTDRAGHDQQHATVDLERGD